MAILPKEPASYKARILQGFELGKSWDEGVQLHSGPPNWKSELLKLNTLPVYRVSPNFTTLGVGPTVRLTMW